MSKLEEEEDKETRYIEIDLLTQFCKIDHFETLSKCLLHLKVLASKTK
jgi:hypothetical protein